MNSTLNCLKCILPVLLLVSACKDAPQEKENAPKMEQEIIDTATAPPQPPQHVHRTYHNNRFNFCVSYAADYFIPTPEPENSDGRKFHNKERDVELLAYGYYKLDDSLEDAYLEARKGDAGQRPYQVVEHQLKNTFFIIKGKEGLQQFLKKQVAHGDYFVVLEAKYPPEKAAELEQLLNSMFGKFPACTE